MKLWSEEEWVRYWMLGGTMTPIQFSTLDETALDLATSAKIQAIQGVEGFREIARADPAKAIRQMMGLPAQERAARQPSSNAPDAPELDDDLVASFEASDAEIRAREQRAQDLCDEAARVIAEAMSRGEVSL